MPSMHALRAIQQFACTNERCADTCCAGLRVSFDAPTLARLRTVIPRERFDEVIEHTSEAGPVDVAAFRPGADGGCQLLSPERLCTLHRDHGVDVLPDICAQFPRVVARRPDGTMEVTGSFACTEYTRLALLGDDALGWEEARADLLPRGWPSDVPTLTDGDLALREAATAILGATAFPLSTRVLALLHLAARKDPAQLEPGAAADRVAGIHRHYEALDVAGDQVAALLLQVLDVRMKSSHGPRFARFIGDVRATLARVGATDAARAYAFYRRERDRLAPRLEAPLRRYAVHQWLRFPVSGVGSPLEYVARFALRMAQAAWFLTLHAVSAEPADPALETAAADALQQVGKQLEAHPDFRDAVTTSLDCSPEDLFARTVVFSKFL